MRIKHSILLDIGDDADMKDVLFGTDETLAQVIIDNYMRMTSGKLTVGVGLTESIPWGDVEAAKGIFIKVDQDCTLKLNGGAEAISLKRAGSSTTDRAKFFTEATLTGATITAGAVAVNAVYVVWGDPTT